MAKPDSRKRDASESDRRRSERADLVVRVDYQTVDELFSDFASNINAGGMFVESDSPHDVGTTVDLQFKLPGGAEPVRVKATVLRVTEGANGSAPGMGLEFEDLEGDARERINALVRHLRAELSR